MGDRHWWSDVKEENIRDIFGNCRCWYWYTFTLRINTQWFSWIAFQILNFFLFSLPCHYQVTPLWKLRKIIANNTWQLFSDVDTFEIYQWKDVWVRLNYAITTHWDPPPPTTIQNISTTTHHHPPPPTTSQNMSTTTHHHPPPAKIFPQPPTTSQNVSTTTYHFPKNGPPPSNSQNIFIYNVF